jgi:hypothetical protein
VVVAAHDRGYVTLTGPKTLTGLRRRKVNVQHILPTPRSVKKVRARRMALRSKIPLSKALRILGKRDRESAAIYRRIYGIRIGEDFTPFHLVVDTTRMTPEQVVDVIAGVASHFFKQSPTRRRRR